VGGQATAGGAPLICQLLEEETARWPFDEGELKRRRRPDFATCAQRRAAHSNVRCGDVTGEGGSDFGNRRWTMTLGWAGLGRSGPR
jgi:hypothetical protein